MSTRFQTLSRDEFKGRLDQGQTFRGAGLYEPQQAPSAEFVFVDLGNGLVVFKRRLS